MNILIATFNRGKLREIRNLLTAGASGIRVASPADLNITDKFEETGDSFQENAEGKSLFYSKLAPEWITVGEDSGLMVDALDGEPGVRSARYAGDRADSGLNIARLLERMRGKKDRRAAFVAVAVLSQNGNPIRWFEGRVEGLILEAPRGASGFGYDPVFYYPPLGKTFAELSVEEKNRVSHRAQVFTKLKEFLLQNKLKLI